MRSQRRRGLYWLPRQLRVDIHDLTYTDSLLARVYQPIGTAPFAAVVDVHGGNWTAGDRCQQEILDRSLAASGVLVAAIDYRLAPPAVYPESVQDVNLAIRWLKSRAPGVALGVIGSSAGGHLALLAALRPFDAVFSALDSGGGADATVAFVVADAPVTDPLRHPGVSRGEHPFWPEAESAAAGSPLRIVLDGSWSALPPVLITHGSADDLVPLDMSSRFVDAYVHAGGEAELRVFEGAGHAFSLTYSRRPATYAFARLVLEFIRAHSRL